MSLEVERQLQGTDLILHIKGVMDYSTLEEFEQLTKIPGEAKKVEVNFSDLEFIDSTGIGSIIGLIHQATEKGVDVSFQNLNEIVKEVFETVGLFTILDVLRKGA